jgi:membrane-associated phospholipid phosphatase
MPILLLLLTASVAGLLIALAFARLEPGRGSVPAALAMMGAAALAVGLLAYLVRGNGTVASIDASVAAWANDNAASRSTRLLYRVTDLAVWPVVLLIGVAVVIYEGRRVPSRYIGPFLLVVFIGDTFITNGIKDAVDRARPALNPIAQTLGASFPSGHTSTAASFYAAAGLILARRRSPRVRALLAGGAGAIAVAVAASRVLLDVHWLSDVFAGLLLGWAWFSLCAIAFGSRRLCLTEPLEHAAAQVPPPEQAQARCCAAAGEASQNSSIFVASR